MNRLTLSCLWSLVLLGACGGGSSGGGSAPATAAVTFVYMAATARDPTIRDCGVGHTHIHPSWRSFDHVDMNANGADEWRVSFSDVPVNSGLRIRVNDANKCDIDPNGATTENVFANGVQLTRIVGTPGNGTEPGLAFSVDANGNVSP